LNQAWYCLSPDRKKPKYTLAAICDKFSSGESVSRNMKKHLEESARARRRARGGSRTTKSNGHEIVNSFKTTLIGDLLKEIRQ